MGLSYTPATLGANTFTGLQTITQGTANAGILASTGYSLTGSNTTSMVNFAGTLNTSGVVDVLKLAITNTAAGAGSKLFNLYAGVAGATSVFSVGTVGDLTSGGDITIPTNGVIGLTGANPTYVQLASTSVQLRGDSVVFRNNDNVVKATLNSGGNLALASVSPTPAANSSAITIAGYSVTGSGTTNMINYAGTLNTSGVVDVFKLATTVTAAGAGSKLLNLYAGAAGTTSVFSVGTAGNLTMAGDMTLPVSSQIGLTSGTTRIVFNPTQLIIESDSVSIWNNDGVGKAAFDSGQTLTVRNGVFVSNGLLNYLGTTTGAADTMVVTASTPFSNTPTVYTKGALYFVQANAANATTTPTINMNTLGAKTIVKRVSTALAANDYLANMMIMLMYDGTNMVLLNPVVN